MKNKDLKFNIYIKFFFVAVSAMVLLCAGCDKNKSAESDDVEFEIDKDYQRGPLTANIRVDKAKVTIAETILLELQAVIEPDYEVKMPMVDKVLQNFGIVDWDSPGNKLDENNNVIYTYRYKLEPFLSGTYSLPEFKFQFYDVNSLDEKKYELTTEPIEVEVTSLLGEQRGELVIADIEGVVEIPTEPSYWWIWIFGAVAVIAIAMICLKLRSKKAKEFVRIFKPAHEIAYERLSELVDKNLIEAGKTKEFYACISDILRHYIEHRFDLKAPEQTTEEFLAELASSNVFDKQDQGRLREFLQHCDLVKFAKYDPTAEQIQKTFNLVKDFIETTKSNDKQIDVTANESEKQAEMVST